MNWLRLSGLVISLTLPMLGGAQVVAPQEARLLGIKLLEADMDKVREQLSNLGGFQQERATLNHRNLDKFFTRSNLRDSYYVEFRYDANGKVISAKRLLRRSGLKYRNDYADLQTEDVARDLVKTFGQPHAVERKSRDGAPTYPAYIWRDEQLVIRIDRVGSDRYGPIFISYELQRDPFVEKIAETPAPRRR
ncbi:MAG: hypothetical protein RBS36_12065 [Thiomicrospira sp.]|jgi:hypothetical protein|nr:hypothetical protein [Thiomicrospira sp.]